MNPTFNLIERPWIPCIRLDGTHVELGLGEVLIKAHTLRALHGKSPLVIGALYRLLLALLHRIFGPEDGDSWGALWQAQRFAGSRMNEYLDKHSEAFYLFHPKRPFYQYDEEQVDFKPIISLVQEMASGNNATLFDHHTESADIWLSPSEAARALLAAQAFALGGGQSGIPHHYFSDAPWARGVTFLIQGDTLFETLMLNLVRYPDDNVMPYTEDDCPTWEMENPLQPERDLPLGYLDYLTWYARRILLKPENTSDGLQVREAKLTQGMRMTKDLWHPTKNYLTRGRQRKPRLLSFSEERALWRDSTSLFRLDDDSDRPPRVFDWTAELVTDWQYLDPNRTERFIALGMATKRGKAAAVKFFRHERMPLPLEYLRDQSLVEDLTTALTMAEAAANKLWGASRTLATFAIAPEADLEEGREPAPEDVNRLLDHWAVDRHYWGQLEIPFRQTMLRLPQEREAALSDWQQTLRRAAWAAFEQAADDLRHDPRKLKAVVRAQNGLGAGLKEVLPMEAAIV